MNASMHDAVLAALRARLEGLGERPHTELSALPDWSTEETALLGRRVRFHTLCSPQPGDRLLVLVRAEWPRVLGRFLWVGFTQGFWSEAAGGRREASGNEIADFFS